MDRERERERERFERFRDEVQVSQVESVSLDSTRWERIYGEHCTLVRVRSCSSIDSLWGRGGVRDNSC